MNIITQPTTPQDLCVDTTYVIEISSAQLADLRNPVLDIRGITGLSFSNIRVEYPRGSGNIEVLTATVLARMPFGVRKRSGSQDENDNDGDNNSDNDTNHN